jgi:hypothetical protein
MTSYAKLVVGGNGGTLSVKVALVAVGGKVFPI